MTLEHLIRANEVLQLDFRFFFGEISYEESLKEKSYNYDDLVKKLEKLELKVSPIENLDEVTDRVRINPVLHEIVSMIFTKDAGILREIRGVIYGYLTRGNMLEELIGEASSSKKAPAAGA